MKKEDLKAAIKANFENNEFATAMELNKDLFAQYEEVAGKRSLTAIVAAYRKKAGATEVVEEEANLEPAEVEEAPTPTEEPAQEEPDYQFAADEEREATLDQNEVIAMLESGNKSLKRYCIVKEEFKQVSDTERFIQTTMIVKPDGFGWENFKDVMSKLGGKKGITERKAGSFWKSKMGLPVGEEITKWTIWKIDEALREYAFRQNASAITRVTTKL